MKYKGKISGSAINIAHYQNCRGGKIMEQQLKKLQVCVYIIIVLLFVNTIALFASLKDPSDTTTDTESEETYEYDVSMFDEISADSDDDF